MDTWVTVTRKKKQNPHKTKCRLEKKFVISQINIIMSEYNTVGIFLYGSTARGDNTENSDIDLLIIWHKKVPVEIEKIKENLEYIFERKVDLVSMVTTIKPCVNDIDFDIYQIPSKNQTTCNGNELFLSNVITDAVVIIGNIEDIKFSKYIGKV